MRKKISILALLLILIISISFSADNNKLSFVTSKDSYIVWNSDYLLLTGKATVTYKKTTIIAKNFFYDIKANTFYITSDATFIEGKEIWNSKNMAYDVNDDELFLFYVNGQSMQRNPTTKKYFKAYYFTNYLFGDSKNNMREFASNSGYFTTCNPEKPHFLDYKIKASKILIYPNDHISAYNVIMYIGFLPVYYFPFYYFPLNGNAKQPLDFSYKMDKDNGIVIHLGLNYNIGGKGKDGSFYYNWIQKSGTTMGISQNYSQDDLKFNFKYDIKNTKGSKSDNWFQVYYSQKPWKLFNVNMRFMTSNSSDSSVFNTGKIQKYLYIDSMNQPFKYSLKLSSIQNVKYEKTTDVPTSSIANLTGQPTTTVNDYQIFPQLTFNYNSKKSDLSLTNLYFLYQKSKRITTTITPQSSKTINDNYTSNLTFKTDISLLWNLSVGYAYTNRDNSIYTSYSTSNSTTTQIASSLQNNFYIKHSSQYIDTYISYENNISNSVPYKLISANLNLKYKMDDFYGNFLTKFGRTLLNDKYTLSFNFNNETPYYNLNYQKTLSNISGLPKKNQLTITNSYKNKFLQTNFKLLYLKKDYNLSYLKPVENLDLYFQSSILNRINLSSKINYDFINKTSVNPYIFSTLNFSPIYFNLKYYMNNDLSFYKLWLYSKFSLKNFLMKSSNLIFDFSTSVNSNYNFETSKFYFKYNVPKAFSFSSSVYYYPDKNIFDNLLLSSSLFFIPGWDVNFTASYSNKEFNDFKFNFVEDLSCWNGFGTVEYSKLNDKWSFKQFTIGLYIKAFPKKPYKLDPISGKFEIGGF